MISPPDDGIVVVTILGMRRSRKRCPVTTRRTTATRLTIVERRLDGLQHDVGTMALSVREGFQEMREGFQQMREQFQQLGFEFSEMRQEMRTRFSDVDRRLDELTDVAHRIYTEHGKRLSDLVEHFENHSAA